jgi:hypothetical protein
MRDCVVVGCGRSGTSLTAGLAERAGYSCGEDLLEPDAGGPTGFFESRSMNELNEALLASHDRELLPGGYSRGLRDGERWLGVLPDDVRVEAPAELVPAMREAIPPSPWCCKDPRFGYTLDAWRPLFGDALYVCVFRHPLATAASIARQVRYGDLTVDERTAVDIWAAIYKRVLGRYRDEGDWLFVHYEQLLDASALDRLGQALGTGLDAELADRSLAHSRDDSAAPGATAPVYEELCAVAGYAP